MLGKGRKSDSPTPPSKQIRQKRWSEVKWSGFHLWSLETPHLICQQLEQSLLTNSVITHTPSQTIPPYKCCGFYAAHWREIGQSRMGKTVIRTDDQ